MEKKIRKKCQEVAQNADISIFRGLVPSKQGFPGNGIKSVTDVTFQFCFHL